MKCGSLWVGLCALHLLRVMPLKHLMPTKVRMKATSHTRSSSHATTRMNLKVNVYVQRGVCSNALACRNHKTNTLPEQSLPHYPAACLQPVLSSLTQPQQASRRSGSQAARQQAGKTNTYFRLVRLCYIVWLYFLPRRLPRAFYTLLLFGTGTSTPKFTHSLTQTSCHHSNKLQQQCVNRGALLELCITCERACGSCLDSRDKS